MGRYKYPEQIEKNYQTLRNLGQGDVAFDGLVNEITGQLKEEIDQLWNGFKEHLVTVHGVMIEGVDDSKKLSATRREKLLVTIQAQAVAIGVGLCSPQQIDSLNILWAAMEAMRRAAADLVPEPDFLLIDGNRCFPDPAWPFQTVVKGDARSASIAAASIVAKVTRDRIMQMLHEEFPAYGWVRNVGYPTKDHYAALSEHGPTPYHRRSFRLESR